MTISDVLTALAAIGLAFVSFQLGGIVWAIVMVRRLDRPEAIRRPADRSPSAHPTPAVGGPTALCASESDEVPVPRRLAGGGGGR